MPFVDKCTYPSNVYNPCQWDKGTFWPIIVITIIIFLILSEYGSQDCTDNKCNERHIESFDNDSTIDILDKINKNVNKWHNVVLWRLALLGSLLATLVITFVFLPKFANGYAFFLISIFLFAVFYFTMAWFNDHWWKWNDYKLEKDLKVLKQRFSTERKHYEPYSANIESFN